MLHWICTYVNYEQTAYIMRAILTDMSCMTHLLRVSLANKDRDSIWKDILNINLIHIKDDEH